VNTALRPLTVNEIIDSRPLSGFQLWTILLCGAALTLDGFDAQVIGYLAPSIVENLRIPLRDFGPIFSASLFGLMIAAMASGPIADRWGRKWAVVVSVMTFAVFSVLTAHASSAGELLVYRFLTGLGLGGAMPNVVALSSEYVPRRLLQVFVAMLFVGMPLGGLIAGVTSSFMVPRWGWRSVFYFGGIVPLVLAVLLILRLPESVRFLAVRGENRRCSALLARISPDLAGVQVGPSEAAESRSKGTPVKHLFTEGRAAATILLWIPFFMNLLLLYFIVSWMPALLRQAGMSISAGVTATTFFSVGGIIGSLLEGPLIKKWGAYLTLLAEFGFCAAFIVSLSFVGRWFALVVFVVLMLGFLVTAAQSGINAIAANFYPTPIRSTGVGWALGVGRVGSIIGPVIAGVLLAMRWSPQQIFVAGALPALCAGVAIIWGNRLRGRANAYQPVSEAG
jgi:MFS transporter, AAHS family, 4-hydroxybenzoate transporter